MIHFYTVNILVLYLSIGARASQFTIVARSELVSDYGQAWEKVWNAHTDTTYPREPDFPRRFSPLLGVTFSSPFQQFFEYSHLLGPRSFPLRQEAV